MQSSTPINDLLSAEHRAILAARGISPEFALTHDLRSIDLKIVKAGDERRGIKTFPGLQMPPVTGIYMPYPAQLDGKPRYRIRVDETTFALAGPIEGSHHGEESGTCPRYLCPQGVSVAPYIPPEVMAVAGDTSQSLYIVEAPLKALSLTQHGHLAIGLGGVVAGAHDRDALKELGEIVAHPELQRIEWRGRRAYVVFDAGVTSNPLVALGAARVWRALSDLGAEVLLTTIPYFHPQDSDLERGVIWGANDQGPDDYLARRIVPEIGCVETFQRCCEASADPLARFQAITGPQVERAIQAGDALRDLYTVAALSVAGETTLSAIVALKLGLTKSGLKQAVEEFRERISARSLNDEPEWLSKLHRSKSGEPRPSVENVELALRNDPGLEGMLGFDELAQAIVFRREPPWIEQYGASSKTRVGDPWSDVDELRLAGYLAKTAGILDVHLPKIKAASLLVASERTVNPVTDYLSSVTWDGVARVGSWLSQYLGVELSEYSANVGKWWLISAVARAYRPGCQADHVLVLEGDQGIGKSTALRILGGEYFSEADLGDLRGKEAALALQGSWIHEFGEGDILNRASFRALKSFITLLADDIVPKYSNKRTSLKRRLVFALTINDGNDYLADDANRRFLPVRCTVIDSAALLADRDQLWAEAVALYRSGAAWHPVTDAERQLCGAQQSERKTVDPWEQSAKTAVRYLETVTVPDLLSQLGVPVERRNRNDSLRAARVLRSIGWIETGTRKNGRHWGRGLDAAPMEMPPPCVTKEELHELVERGEHLRLVEAMDDAELTATLMDNV